MYVCNKLYHICLANLKEQLAAHLGTLVRKVWSGQFTALAPRAFRLLLGKIYHPFSSHRQQDCQEFLAVLLDSLHENNLSKRWSLSKTSEEPAQQVEEMEVDEPVEPKGFEENTKDDISNKDPSSSTDPSSETTVKPSTYSSFVTEIFQGTLRNEVCHMEMTSLNDLYTLYFDLTLCTLTCTCSGIMYAMQFYFCKERTIHVPLYPHPAGPGGAGGSELVCAPQPCQSHQASSMHYILIQSSIREEVF